MRERVLCVDDDASILASYVRVLRKHFEIDGALGGEEALRRLEGSPPYAVVVSDMRMPGMDGAQLLAEFQRRAPDTVRIVLTGQADVASAIRAVNEGRVFRFLTKPCPPDALCTVLDAAAAQHRLQITERDVMESTLNATLKVLADVMALVKPAAFGRAARIRRLVAELAGRLGKAGDWKIDTAALLSQLGCLALPEETLERMYRGQPLTEEEQQLFLEHPRIARDLLQPIPRLEEVAVIIGHQERAYERGLGASTIHGEALPLGSRILKVACDADALLAAGATRPHAMRALRARRDQYDPLVLTVLAQAWEVPDVTYAERAVAVTDLADGMLLAENLSSRAGVILAATGQEITAPLRARLALVARTGGIAETVRVQVPVD